MKKSFVLALFLLLAGQSISSAADDFGPKIAAKELHHDFGKAAQGVHLSHVFEIRNEGTATLVIERVQSS